MVVLPEVIACACADFPRVFLTRVVVQNVGNVEPLGARMRHRIPPFFRVFPDMTLSVGLKKEKKWMWSSGLGRWP